MSGEAGAQATGSGRPGLLERAAQRAVAAHVSLPPGALLNMELSNLAFAERVLELAADPRIPLLERVRFAAILGSNLDEFFMTRVAGFKRQVGVGNQKRTLDGRRPEEQLRMITEGVRELTSGIYEKLLPTLRNALADHDICLLSLDELTAEEVDYIDRNYAAELDSVIAPIVVARGATFPHVRNLRPALLARLASPDESAPELAIVELPGDLPRLIPLPGGKRFVLLEEVVRGNLPQLLEHAAPRTVEAHVFRVTRSGNLSLDAEEMDDLVGVVAENVARRPFQPVVRIEVESGMPADLRSRLLRELQAEARSRASELDEADIYPVRGPIDLQRLDGIAGLPIPELHYPRARRTSPLRKESSVFSQIRRKDVLLRFPTHSFEKTIERFIYEAATDRRVESIRITLYRTSRASRIVRLLRLAHRNGKQVMALIEVKASFDERRNIEWARALEAAGIRVFYGPRSLKVHGKIASIVRVESGERRVYSYIATGNLNAATAAAYTDLGVLTADRDIGAEVEELFEAMAGGETQPNFRHLIVAPFNMRRRFLDLIEREIEHCRAGRSGAMTIKLNGLADREMIAMLYRASAAGVRVDLIIRGICSLRPGVPGLSENIRVVAIAGRYLEHSRIYRFENDGHPDYFIGSADWRGRNLSRRVEVVVPIRDPDHRATLDAALANDLAHPDAWDLRADGSYVRRREAPREASHERKHQGEETP